MNNVISSKDNHNHTLVFYGQRAESIFVICLGQFLIDVYHVWNLCAVGDGEMSTLYLYP